MSFRSLVVPRNSGDEDRAGADSGIPFSGLQGAQYLPVGLEDDPPKSWRSPIGSTIEFQCSFRLSEAKLIAPLMRLVQMHITTSPKSDHH